MHNFVIITLDSLRYDVAMLANTPTLNSLMHKYQVATDTWHKTFAHATYTLPAHVSMFSGGKFPCNEGDVAPFSRLNNLFGYTFTKSNSLFKLTEDNECITCYFKDRDYRTIGLGSVGWFDDLLSSSKDFWGKYFNEFYYQSNFSVKNSESFRNQINFTRDLLKNNTSDLFYFVNVGSTHAPYRDGGTSIDAQKKALEYIDDNIAELISLFGSGTDIFICGDHGECFGEDGLWGHSFYHHKVMEVPACYLEIP